MHSQSVDQAQLQFFRQPGEDHQLQSKKHVQQRPAIHLEVIPIHALLRLKLSVHFRLVCESLPGPKRKECEIYHTHCRLKLGVDLS